MGSGSGILVFAPPLPRELSNFSCTFPIPPNFRVGNVSIKAMTPCRVQGHSNWPSGLFMSAQIFSLSSSSMGNGEEDEI